jgi:hypothetical protein
MRRKLSFIAVALAIGAASVPASASAALITVNNANDNPANPATECKGVALDCSLRQAVDKAHTGDRIQVPASVPAIALTNGVISISKSLTISGAGASKNKIDGQLSTQLFAIPTGSSVTISGLTLTRGEAAFGAAFEMGGSTLTLNGDALTNNVSGGSNTDGFGVIEAHGLGTSRLTIINSLLTGNHVGGGGTSGGGFGVVDFDALGANSTLTVSGTTFSGNFVGGGGADGFGTVEFEGSGGNDALTVSNSQFTSNTVGGGGASDSFGGGINATLSATGTISIKNSAFTSNVVGSDGTGTSGTGVGFGGGVDASLSAGGTFTLENDSFTGDRVGGGGGGGFDSGAGYGAGLSIGVQTNENVTIAGNAFGGLRAGGNGGAGQNSGAAFGGAINVDSTPAANPVALINNTITGTVGGGTAGAGPDSGGGFGGAIYVEDGPAALVNDTIDANSLGANGTGGGLEGTGATDPSVTVRNTIVSSNQAGATSSDCGSVFTSQGHNITSTSPSECGFTAAGDKIADPHLGILRANGGPTPTQALEGGPAINGGTNTGCPATDQRGVKRPQEGTCDVGAYEQAPPASASTGTATGITPSSASLHGTASNPDAVAATAMFLFGTTASYGLTTASQSVPAGGTGVAISLPASQLKPSTTYHYRIVVTNPDGQLMGTDGTFKTPAPKLSGLTVHPKKFKSKNGATVSYTDNGAGTTTLTLLRSKGGFRSGSKCVAKRPRHGKLKKCTILKKIGSITRTDHAGHNSFHFNGKVRGHRLAPGKYVLEAVTKVSGKKSKPVKATFRVS